MPESEYYEELARKLRAAHTAHRARIGMDYAYKTYVKNEPISEFWIDAAIVIDDAINKALEQKFKEPEAIKGIQ